MSPDLVRLLGYFHVRPIYAVAMTRTYARTILGAALIFGVVAVLAGDWLLTIGMVCLAIGMTRLARRHQD
jgi:1,4-dihydroxy-2-naphthoate octaprenyltransferase